MDDIDKARSKQLEKIRQEHPEASFATQLALADGILMFVLTVMSLPMMLLLRHKIGYRQLKPLRIAAMFVVLCIVGSSASFANKVIPFSSSETPSSSNYYYSMLLLPVLFSGFAIYQRMSAWRRITKGERWHTKSRGTSYLAAVLPMREYTIQRRVEPILCAIVGLLILGVLKMGSLGMWFILCGVCLSTLEAIIYDVQLQRTLDQLDSIVEAEVIADNDAFFHKQDEGMPESAPSIAAAAGITVGFSPQLEEQIARRRAALNRPASLPSYANPVPVQQRDATPSVTPHVVAFCQHCGQAVHFGTSHDCPESKTAGAHA